MVIASVRILAIAIVVASTSGISMAGTDLKRFVATEVSRYITENRVPGCSVAAGTARRLLVADGYGLAGPGRPASAHTVYPIASLSKQFTAAVTLLATERRLAAAEKLDLEAPVSRYLSLPDLPGDLRLRHLLYHSSGLRSFTDYRKFHNEQFRPTSTDEMLEDIAGYGTAFPPGKRGQYSNTNYYLLALVLQRHHGTALETLLKDALLDPLKMDDTGPISPAGESHDLATGSDDDGFVFRTTHRSWVTGAGDLQSSVIDLARWHQALLSGMVLSRETLSRMLSAGHANPEPAVAGERLAAGWMEIPLPKTSLFYHQGFIHGFSSATAIDRPETDRDGKFVIVLCNRHLAPGLPGLVLRVLDGL